MERFSSFVMFRSLQSAHGCLQTCFSIMGRHRAPSQAASRPAGARWVACSAAMSVTVTLPDGKALELPDGATGADAAAAIGPGLARAALAVEVGGPPRPAEGG